MANKQAQKLRDVAQARQLEFSTQIFWQKKLIWKKQLRTKRNGSAFFNIPTSFDLHFHTDPAGLPGAAIYVAIGLAFLGVPDDVIPAYLQRAQRRDLLGIGGRHTTGFDFFWDGRSIEMVVPQPYQCLFCSFCIAPACGYIKGLQLAR